MCVRRIILPGEFTELTKGSKFSALSYSISEIDRSLSGILLVPKIGASGPFSEHLRDPDRQFRRILEFIEKCQTPSNYNDFSPVEPFTQFCSQIHPQPYRDPGRRSNPGPTCLESGALARRHNRGRIDLRKPSYILLPCLNFVQ